MPGRIVRVDRVRQDYFQWLCEVIRINDMPESYNILVRKLHSIEFVWKISNDDNRAKDGIGLREEYIEKYNPRVKSGYLDGDPCSVLEMLIALAGRMAFNLADPNDNQDLTPRYFWDLVGNLGLLAFTDDRYARFNLDNQCESIVYSFMDREYRSDGYGGLFPLKYPTSDQRELEIWYQMHAYLAEKYPS